MSEIFGAEIIAKVETRLQRKAIAIAYWSVTLLFAGSITLSGIRQRILPPSSSATTAIFSGSSLMLLRSLERKMLIGQFDSMSTWRVC